MTAPPPTPHPPRPLCSPLCQGLLTGKYSKDNTPRGPRGASFTDGRLAAVGTLVDLMRIVGQEHGGKSPTQVRLRLCLCESAYVRVSSGVCVAGAGVRCSAPWAAHRRMLVQVHCLPACMWYCLPVVLPA